MSKEKEISVEDDPDIYLIESSVPDVRAFEQKTRNAIETQKKELRAMVGEQYQDLISAADAIITMSTNAQSIQSNFERMQTACDINSIKHNAKKVLQLRDDNRTHIDTNRKYIYVIAALVKSLADVPEQIWHALENHRYLHASRLYVLAKEVHAYLEEEKKKSVIDLEVAFPVIQRQWDAVSAFGPQIVQRSIHYLRVSEQSSEHIAEIMVGLMLLDDLTYQGVLDTLLEMRFNVIQDVLHHYTKSTDTMQHRISHQLREITLIIQRTLNQAHTIFAGSPNSLIEIYVDSFQSTFLIPSKSSHGNETPSQPAITRLFSPSANVHLIVRYLPDSLQTYLPQFSGKQPLMDVDTSSWLMRIRRLFEEQLPQTLQPITTQRELIEIRHKLLLDAALWDQLYRDLFYQHAQRMLDRALQQLIDQVDKVIWPAVNSKKAVAMVMPWSSTVTTTNNATAFLKSLKETRTDALYRLQHEFDMSLSIMCQDVMEHLNADEEHDDFHIKADSDKLRVYFQDKCLDTMISYAEGLKQLMTRISNEWTDQKTINDLHIFIGRLAKNIATLSKELPKALLISAHSTPPAFELRSSINKEPAYAQVQQVFIQTFHEAHDTWIHWLTLEFAKKLKTSLTSTKWNDRCPSITVWENVEEDVKLPTQSSNTTVLCLFYVCEEIQRIHSTMLDQVIMAKLRNQLSSSVHSVFESYLQAGLEITENGALQLIFDYLFLNTVLDTAGGTKLASNTVFSILQNEIDPINWASYEPHLKPCVHKFYIKQCLLFGILTSANNDIYESARKTNQQQQQYNVLPLAPQATRFTLLPIGHLNSSSIRTR